MNRMLKLPSGVQVPALGLGTWHMGERAREKSAEVAALRLGLELGVSLIDTAEMYGEGGAEEVVAEAVRGRRGEVFIVSKVYPHNASRKGVAAACERSLKRLQSDYIDLYLLHWRGSIPLEETVEAFTRLQAAGKIAHWGVSNFDRDDMEELVAVAGGTQVAANQVLYNLSRRGIEWALVPWCRERALPIMAYSPIEQGRILKNAALVRVAKRHGVSAAQVALAWLLAQPQTIVIPKATRLEHVRENAAARTLELSTDDISELEQAFPRPPKGTPLELL